MTVDNLLAKAYADREARPWRYYRFEHEDYKRMLDQLADERDALRAELTLFYPDGVGRSREDTIRKAQELIALLQKETR